MSQAREKHSRVHTISLIAATVGLSATVALWFLKIFGSSGWLAITMTVLEAVLILIFAVVHCHEATRRNSEALATQLYDDLGTRIDTTVDTTVRAVFTELIEPLEVTAEARIAAARMRRRYGPASGGTELRAIKGG